MEREIEYVELSTPRSANARKYVLLRNIVYKIYEWVIHC